MENNTAGEQVTNILREKIFSGEIEDSIELTQTWIAEQLGVSRMPIREALLNLELEGFIERMDNRHTKVIGFDREQSKSRLRILSSLENEAALAILKSEESQVRIERLSQILDGQFDKKREILFHTSLFSESQDRFLNQVFGKMIKPTLELFIKNRQTGFERSQLQLRAILENMALKNETKILESIKKYFDNLSIK